MKHFLFLALRLGVTALLGWYLFTLIDFRSRTVEGPVVDSWFPGQVVLTSDDTGEVRRIPAASLTEEELAAGHGRVTIPGVVETIRGADVRLLLLAGIVPAFLYAACSYRWSILLRSQGVHLPLRRVTWLFWVGQFFSMALPGITGGDLIKAFYVTKATHRKASAFATIVVDRVMGLTALLMVAIVVAVFLFDDPALWFVPWILVGALACVAIGAVVFFSSWVRRVMRFAQLIDYLPFSHLIRKLDDAFLQFRDAKRAVLAALAISFGVHATMITANYVFGLAVGITEARFFHYATFIPIIFALSSLPISMGGLGVRESLYGIMLGSVGAQVNQAVLVSLLFWFASLVWSLPGGVLYALRKDVTTAHEMEAAMTPDGDETDG